MKIKLFLLLNLFVLSDCVFAEGGCPPGSYPVSPPATNVCYPFPESQSTAPVAQPQAPRGHWETRWGAMATDNVAGSLGSVVGIRSKREASKMALKQCQEKGGKKCNLDLTFYNQCALMVVGDKTYNMASAPTVEEATEIGMKRCAMTNINCRVYYSDCSPAEWVKY